MIAKTISLIKSKPDFFGAVLTGYALIGLNILIQIFLVPLYLNTLGKYQFGVLMMLLSFINYAVIGIGWMSGGVLRVMGEYSANNDREGFYRAYAVSKLIYVGYAILVSIIMVGLCLYLGDEFLGNIPDEYSKSVRLSIITGAVYFIVLFDFSVERLALTAMRRQVAAGLLQIISLLVFVVSVIPWLLTGGNLEGVLVCLMVGIILARAISWYYWRRTEVSVGWKWIDSGTWPLIKRLTLSMGIGYFLYGIIFLTMQADVMIIGWLGGAEIAAEFVLVWKIAEIIIQILWKIPEYLSPYLIKMDTLGENEWLQRTYSKSMRWMTVLSLLAGVIYALFGSWIVQLWVGPASTPQNNLAYILAGSAIFWLGIARIPGVFAHTMVRLKSLNTIAGLELIGKLVLTLVLFPRVGYLAPLIAISAIHVGGIAFAYRLMIKKILTTNVRGKVS